MALEESIYGQTGRTKEQDLLAVEKQSVKVLKNTFADIAEVEIERTGFNTMTGSYRIVVTLKNTTGSTAYFDYGFVKIVMKLMIMESSTEKFRKRNN